MLELKELKYEILRTADTFKINLSLWLWVPIYCKREKVGERERERRERGSLAARGQISTTSGILEQILKESEMKQTNKNI